ncbi:flavodoxin/nitric oxide synthase [Candidatus Symbiothrix dinenymphae]|nr:flavodoxin/nitric oxide synthase [Candidatus Symbiothrix dinenymphae]
MKIKEIAKGIYSVGVADWNVRNFHGYLTQKGTSYNAYLIMDEKITLIDTVKAHFSQELIDRISQIVSLDKIDYVVSNHVEMDHSGALPEVMKHLPNATVLTSQAGEREFKLHFNPDWKFQIVKTGDSISLGKRTLSFIMTPMVHWPDNMVTYCPEEKILFSNDAFGQHLASSNVFDDEPLDVIMEEAKKYYANIIMPYSAQVVGALEAVQKLAIQMIAPSHGLIWKNNIPAILEHYTKWAHCGTDKKVVIAFDSMYGSTEKIAYAIRNAFEAKGYEYKFFRPQIHPHLRHHNRLLGSRIHLRRLAHTKQKSDANSSRLPHLFARIVHKNKKRIFVRLLRLGATKHQGNGTLF